MKIHKRIISLIIIVTMLLGPTQICLASDNPPGSVFLEQVLKTHKYLDTYYLKKGGTPYKCYVDNSDKSRLYLNQTTNEFVVDEQTLRSLEMIYLVNERTGDIFNDYKLREDIATTRNKIVENSDNIKTALGTKILGEKMGGVFGQYASFKLGDDKIIDELLTVFGTAASNMADVEKSIKELINHIIVDSLDRSAGALDEALYYYNQYNSDELKCYENIEKIVVNYDFSAVTFKSSWNYAVKLGLPQNFFENVSSLGYQFASSFFDNSIGFLTKSNTLDILNSVNTITDKTKALKEFQDKNFTITNTDVSNIRDIALFTYNEKVDDRLDKFINMIGDYDSNFLEFYSTIKDEKYKLMEDMARTGYKSVNKQFGALKSYTLSDWAEGSANKLKDIGILNDNTLYPYGRTLTREDFCKLLYSVYRYYFPNKAISYKDSFIDTDNPSVLKLNSLGIIDGTSANKFSPNVAITREEVCAVIGRLLTLIPYKGSELGSISFKDSDNISSWAIDYVQKVSSLGIMTGSDGYFNPKNSMTFEEAVVVCNRLFNGTIDPELEKYVPSYAVDHQFTYLNIKGDSTKEAVLSWNNGGYSGWQKYGTCSEIMMFEKIDGKWKKFYKYTDKGDKLLNNTYLGYINVNNYSAPVFINYGEGYSYHYQSLNLLAYDSNENTVKENVAMLAQMIKINDDAKNLPQTVIANNKKLNINTTNNLITVNEGQQTETFYWDGTKLNVKIVLDQSTKNADLTLTMSDGIKSDDYYSGVRTPIQVHVGETIYFKQSDTGLSFNFLVSSNDQNNLFQWLDSKWYSLKILKAGTFTIWAKNYDRHFIFEAK